MHRLIAGARFVVTDTYHLVVNALNQGRANGLPPDTSESKTDRACDDAKKRALLEQAGMAGMLAAVRDPDRSTAGSWIGWRRGTPNPKRKRSSPSPDGGSSIWRLCGPHSARLANFKESPTFEAVLPPV